MQEAMFGSNDPASCQRPWRPKPPFEISLRYGSEARASLHKTARTLNLVPPGTVMAAGVSGTTVTKV